MTGRRMARCAIILVASAYAFWAMGHALNLAGLTDFAWSEASPTARAIEVALLILDVLVVIGLAMSLPFGPSAFYLAAGSQIGLYSFGRAWALDLPANSTLEPDQIIYCDLQVLFHVATLGVVVLALKRIRKRRRGYI